MDASHDNEILRESNKLLGEALTRAGNSLQEARRVNEELLARLAEAMAAAAADHAVAEAAEALPAGLDESPRTRGLWRTEMAEEAKDGDPSAIAMQRLLAALDASRKP